MQTRRTLAMIALLLAGCGYSVPTDDSKYHLACYSQSSCPSGWTCGSVWRDNSICNDPSRQSVTHDGHILMSDGSVVWGNGVNEPNISFNCADGFTPVAALGQYCYQTAPMCAETPCQAGQKCGFALGPGAPIQLRCLDSASFSTVSAPMGCGGPCPSDHPHCYVILEPSSQSMEYSVCSTQP